MTYEGTVHRGVVVFPSGSAPPEGTIVTVVPSQGLAPPDKSQPAASCEQTIGQKLAALGRWVESQPCNLPEDLAENHDHYLHGIPKKQ